ncbi:hypothetical protein BaRGS_00019730 [Batillaria attramentaria]|uniref:Uncharacterized protein n=1 Tax=Batillaria attramentaria TaxID=370345 RepID=A0ABD0KPT5_9CAEN
MEERGCLVMKWMGGHGTGMENHADGASDDDWLFQRMSVTTPHRTMLQAGKACTKLLVLREGARPTSFFIGDSKCTVRATPSQQGGLVLCQVVPIK